jgi:hypothetical protein
MGVVDGLLYIYIYIYKQQQKMVWGAGVRPTCSKMKGHTWPFTNQKEKIYTKAIRPLFQKEYSPFKKKKGGPV